MGSTVGRAVAFTGVGIHGNVPATVVLRPALAGGIRFRRIDAPGSDDIAATWERVRQDRLRTVLAGRDGASISTVEHLMAALSGLGVTDALVEVDGPEIPILDGSALPFASGILRAGLLPSAGRPAIRVTSTVAVWAGDAWARLEPSDAPGLTLDCRIDFEDPAIGRSEIVTAVTPERFLACLAPARTFASAGDIDAMRAAGLALGGSLDNAVVVSGGRVLNGGGLRFADEFVRHKALDALGDLALAGAPLHARYVASRPGHALNAALVAALMRDSGAWECGARRLAA